jgi:hypothetical protein
VALVAQSRLGGLAVLGTVVDFDFLLSLTGGLMGQVDISFLEMRRRKIMSFQVIELRRAASWLLGIIGYASA